MAEPAKIGEPEMLAALEALHQSGMEFGITWGVAEMWAVIGQLQLALRHPANTGPTADLARQVAQALIDEVERRAQWEIPEHAAALAELGRRGFDEAHDG